MKQRLIFWEAMKYNFARMWLHYRLSNEYQARYYGQRVFRCFGQLVRGAKHERF